MRAHFQRETERLNRQLLALETEVQADLRAAVRAVTARDAAAAKMVMDREGITDAMEVDIEEECLKILALHQPVAGDLRYVVTVLKVNQALERIGDIAEHIAKRALVLQKYSPVEPPFRIGAMAERVQVALRTVLEAFVAQDREAAQRVCAADAEIDSVRRDITERVKVAVMRDPAMLEPLLEVMHIARHLERIADHTTNIAEDLMYLIDGRIVRHTAEVSDKGGGG